MYIPKQQRFLLVMIIPLVITIAVMQLLTGFIVSQLDFVIIGVTAFKIVCITIIIISSRFFIGQDGFKAFINILPHTLKLFFLIFIRILYMLLKLNRMIVFQIQSRIDLKTKEKYYIPKYYSIAFLSNQFYALAHYKNGILSRTINTIPDFIIHNEHSMDEYISSGVIVFILIVYCISQGM
ncbi:MAG: hypothetical protein WBK20_06120 [Spirochaetota bacterium]